MLTAGYNIRGRGPCPDDSTLNAAPRLIGLWCRRTGCRRNFSKIFSVGKSSWSAARPFVLAFAPRQPGCADVFDSQREKGCYRCDLYPGFGAVQPSCWTRGHSPCVTRIASANTARESVPAWITADYYGMNPYGRAGVFVLPTVLLACVRPNREVWHVSIL